MTPHELTDPLRTYAAGLEAELALLRQLQRLSDEQQAATRAHDVERLGEIPGERSRLMAGLAIIEDEIGVTRQLLAEHREAASALTLFKNVAALHESAAALVSRIITADQGTMAALRDAEAARREAAHAIETGSTTLNAYRRVINPSATGPLLFDRHG